ncbi:MAG: hypothetical protein QF864_06100 [SAR202 cluster bacterium]|nr:hypothetical protein [SAR202 cluster bacterium]
MNSRFIIIAILIFIKVIGVASRVKAENYIPGYTCDSSMTYKINYPYYYKTSQISSNKPIYRCGNRKIYEDA